MKTLDYYGKDMKWTATRVHAISGGAPLLSAEPPSASPADIRRSLEDGYALVVELQPGDGTRYSLILSPCESGFAVTSSGGSLSEPLRQHWDAPVALSPVTRNAWTGRLVAWWVLCLVEGSAVA